MKREITIDDLPAPGEPLVEKIAEVNQEIIDEEIRERAARIQSKLPKRELRQLNRRYEQLHHQLNRQRYNQLISERGELLRLCTQLKHELKTRRHSKPAYEAKQARMRQAAALGLKLDQKITPLIPLAEEFGLIVQRLKAHNDVIAWEKKEAEDFANLNKEAMVWLEQIKSVCIQSGRLNHRGKDSKGREFTYIPQIERIIIKDDKVMYQIKTSEQGLIERLFGRWHSALPLDVDIEDLTCQETLENLSAGCKRTVTTERSQNGVNLFWVISRMDSPDGIPRSYPYSKVIPWYPIEEHRSTPWAAGVTSDRKVKWFNFEDYPHVLIAGSPGGGKSTHLNGMIATIASMNRPDEVRMVMIDLKGGVEFVHWKELKHIMGNIVKSPAAVLEALRMVREVMENRLEIFEAAKAKKLSAYNAKAAEPMPRLLVFVDEMSTLIGLGELTTDIHTELRVISAQGRAAGVHLILATQHPSVDVVPGWVKTNMGIRIASKMPSQIASQIILDTGSAALLPVVPGRMVFSVGREEIIAQSANITDEEINQAVRLSHAHPDPVVELVEEPGEIRPKFGAADVIALALTRLDGSLSAKRIHEIVGNEVISRRNLETIVKELTEMRGIEHDGVWYQIRKLGKGYYLKAMPQHHDGQVTSDTDEIGGIERGIEAEELLEEAIAS